MTTDTFERLGGARDYSQVILRVDGTAEQQGDKEYINQVANVVADKIEKSGRTVQRIEVPEPGRLRMQDLFDSLALLLTPLGLLALLLSGFLVVNTISALMAQQVRQIGVMKAIGARRYQIIGLYLGAVLVYSLVALVIAVPLTVVVAGGIAQFLGAFVNVEFPALSLPMNVLFIQIAVGILVPLVAAMQPILKGTSVTVREAVSDFGAGEGQFGADWTTAVAQSRTWAVAALAAFAAQYIPPKGAVDTNPDHAHHGRHDLHDRRQRPCLTRQSDRARLGLQPV